MSWPLAIVIGLVAAAVFIYLRGRGMAVLYADAHLTEILAAIPRLRDDAAGAIDVSPPVAKIRTKAPMLIAYSIATDGDTLLHHLSLSTTVTPSRATGAFFLALVDTALGFEGGARRAFVTQTRVFHLVRELSREQHERLVTTPLAALSLGAARERAMVVRDEIAAILETHELSPKASADQPSSSA